jgi:biotin operon repressor
MNRGEIAERLGAGGAEVRAAIERLRRVGHDLA